MSTPVTLKQMEEAKKRSEQRKKTQQDQPKSLMPMSSYGYDGYGYRNSKTIDFTSDFAGGRQYTSFEKKNGFEKKGKGSGKPPELEPLEVKTIPAEMETDDYEISKDNLICFSGTTHFLSNFYSCSINIDGHDYLSVEHYYQACKLYTLAGAEYAAQLRHMNNPARAKTYARRVLTQLHVGKDKVDEWKRTHGIVLLHHALVHKFVQNVDLRQKLLETGDKILAHTFERDNLFACAVTVEELEKWATEHAGEKLKVPVDITVDNLPYIPLVGKGKNLLGIISMKVRKQLVNYKPAEDKAESDPLLNALLEDFKFANLDQNKQGPAHEKTS